MKPPPKTDTDRTRVGKSSGHVYRRWNLCLCSAVWKGRETLPFASVPNSFSDMRGPHPMYINKTAAAKHEHCILESHSPRPNGCTMDARLVCGVRESVSSVSTVSTGQTAAFLDPLISCTVEVYETNGKTTTLDLTVQTPRPTRLVKFKELTKQVSYLASQWQEVKWLPVAWQKNVE